MQLVPFIAVEVAYPRQIGPRAFAAPLEWMVIDELSSDRVMTVAFRFRAQRPDHLRMAVVAAFANVDIPALQGDRTVRFQSGNGFGRRPLEKQRHNFHQSS